MEIVITDLVNNNIATQCTSIFLGRFLHDCSITSLAPYPRYHAYTHVRERLNSSQSLIQVCACMYLRLHLINDPTLEELWSGLSLSVEVESNTSITTNPKVVVHGDDLCTPLQSEVAPMLNLNLPSKERKREREREREKN